MTTEAPKVDQGRVRLAAERVGHELEAERRQRVAVRDGTPNLAAAIVAFQGAMPTVHKGQTATIPGKDGRGGYSYKYADLADVSVAVMPLLTKHGLGFVCGPERAEGGTYELVGYLVHTSGEYASGALPIHGRSAQEIGSSITYGRRYLLGCLTGVVTDEDDDGSRAQQAQAARASVDRSPAAAALWARVQGTTHLDEVQALWREANGQGLLGVPVEHLDGSQEPLGEALRRYGTSLAGGA